MAGPPEQRKRTRASAAGARRCAHRVFGPIIRCVHSSNIPSSPLAPPLVAAPHGRDPHAPHVLQVVGLHLIGLGGRGIAQHLHL